VIAKLDKDLPILHYEFSFWQTRHLPGLAAAAIPIDVRVAERYQP
jgi:hypothetical protein